MLQSGHTAARDNVLKPGQRLNLKKLNEGHNFPISSEFAEKVGEFSIDFLEVSIYRPGIIYNNEFFGNGILANPDPLFKYPSWSNIPRYNGARPGIGGVGGNIIIDPTHRVSDFSVLFARDDWFPDPVLVIIQNRNAVSWSSRSLSSFQDTVLTSLVSQGTQRRNIERLIVVPYSLKSIALKIANLKNPKVIPSSDAQITFDFSDPLESGATFAGDSSVIKFKRDANNIPLGLKLDFKKRKNK